MTKFTAHCVVKNEDQWIWYALSSILPFVENILIYDTGSTDKTVEIIKSFHSPKIIFEEKGPVDRKKLVMLREEQVRRTKTEWFFLLDGDEIWPEENLKKSMRLAKNATENIAALIHSVKNCVGDIYHYLPESAGKYKIGRYQGNLNIRFMRKTPDLRIIGEYPLEFYADSKGSLQSQGDKLLFAHTWYLHTSFLKRSSQDPNKKSGSLGRRKIWEKGIHFKKGELPEVLKSATPYTNQQFKKRSTEYEIIATLIDPLLKIKRTVL